MNEFDEDFGGVYESIGEPLADDSNVYWRPEMLTNKIAKLRKSGLTHEEITDRARELIIARCDELNNQLLEDLSVLEDLRADIDGYFSEEVVEGYLGEANDRAFRPYHHGREEVVNNVVLLTAYGNLIGKEGWEALFRIDDDGYVSSITGDPIEHAEAGLDQQVEMRLRAIRSHPDFEWLADDIVGTAAFSAIYARAEADHERIQSVIDYGAADGIEDYVAITAQSDYQQGMAEEQFAAESADIRRAVDYARSEGARFTTETENMLTDLDGAELSEATPTNNIDRTSASVVGAVDFSRGVSDEGLSGNERLARELKEDAVEAHIENEAIVTVGKDGLADYWLFEDEDEFDRAVDDVSDFKDRKGVNFSEDTDFDLSQFEAPDESRAVYTDYEYDPF